MCAYYTIPYYTILYYTILYYTNLIYYTQLHYSTLFYTVLYYDTLLYTILLGTLPYNTTIYHYHIPLPYVLQYVIAGGEEGMTGTYNPVEFSSIFDVSEYSTRNSFVILYVEKELNKDFGIPFLLTLYTIHYIL